MKKMLPLIFISILVFTLSACSQQISSVPSQLQSSAAGNVPPSGSQVQLPLLKDYPQNILPVYQPVSLASSAFSMRGSDVYEVGKDIYSVTYESAATQQNVFKYYSGLLTSTNAAPSESTSPADGGQDQDDSGAYSNLSGKIGSFGVEIDFLGNADTTTVYLTLGLPKDQYVDLNPYFAGYPAGLVDAYGKQNLLESTYQEQYYGGKTVHYTTVYQTSVTQQEFTDYYNKSYVSKQGFSQTAADNQTGFSWQDQGFDISVLYTGGVSGYITIDASKAE